MAGNGKKTLAAVAAPKNSMRCACSALGGDEIKNFPGVFASFGTSNSARWCPPKSAVLPHSDVLSLSLSLMRALTFTAAVFGSTRGAERSITFGRVFVCLYGAGHWPGILNISHHLLPKAPHAEILQLLAVDAFLWRATCLPGMRKENDQWAEWHANFSLSIKLTQLLRPYGVEIIFGNWSRAAGLLWSRPRMRFNKVWVDNQIHLLAIWSKVFNKLKNKK